jgi:hypothetical protein
MNQVAPFVVSHELVAELAHLASVISGRSRYTTMSVPAEEFPAWCAALKVQSFYAHRLKNGNRWVSTNIVHTVDTTVSAEMRMLSVQCDTPPAPWVEFPNGEGDRRYMFKSTMDNENETESK